VSKPNAVSSLTAGEGFRVIRAVSLLASLVLSFVLAGCGLSSDSALERLFRDHEKEFEELRSLSMRTSAIEMISAKEVRTTERLMKLNGRLPNEVLGEQQSRLSESEWRKFMKLMQDLSIDTAFIDVPRNGVTLRINGPSLFNGDTEKGISYSESPPTPLVSDLDGYEAPLDQQDRHGGFTAYKALKANWFLYFAR
jgi:hypothetical protein